MPEQPEPLSDRRVLVTGATSGIGRAVVHAVVAAGGRVGIVARTAADVDAVVAELGDRAFGHPADVVDPGAASAAVDAVEQAWGGLDAVVNAAGIVRPGGIVATGPDDWRAMFEVNVLGLLNVTAAAVPALRRSPRADVVNVSSMSGRRRASVEMTVYSASKFAVHVLSDGLHEELADDDVRVTTIAPGFVRTPIFDGVADEELRTRYQRAVTDRGLDPTAVAAQVVHALSQPPGVDLLEIAMVSTDQ